MYMKAAGAKMEPWIEISQYRGPLSLISPNDTLRAGVDIYQAVFACLISPKPFAEIVKRKWGFNHAFLYTEAIDRQQLLIEAQHPANDLAQTESADCHTLALRCWHEPGQENLNLVLLGKVCASEPENARHMALEYWHGISTAVPYDYHLAPLTSPDEYRSLSGIELVKSCQTSSSLIEIRRLETTLFTGHSNIYLLGKWQTSERANELLWQAIMDSPKPVLFSVALRPTILLEYERLALAEMDALAGQAKQESSPQSIQLEMDWITRFNAERLQLRRPYLMQCHLAAPSGVSDYFSRIVGSVFTRSKEGEPDAPGYIISHPGTKEQLACWRDKLVWAEPNLDMGDVLDARFARVRYMVGAREANTVFRLPFPPEGGIPGVKFADR
ncbi:MAG: hypothetical protein AB1894_26300 [Chloroflexota bacterium]